MCESEPPLGRLENLLTPTKAATSAAFSVLKPMTSKILFLAVLAVVAGGLSACRPDWPRCRDDARCRDDVEHNEGRFLYCINGQCQECRNDGDCGPGRACQANRCRDLPECAVDADCGKCQFCRGSVCVPECKANDGCAANQTCEHGCCINHGVLARVVSDDDAPACQPDAIYFDFDRSNLRPDAVATLSENAKCGRVLAVEGHCDERGTTEYNLALGERRARATAAYLRALGVAEPRAVSYGEEQPVCSEASETCWARNRRAETKVTR